MFAALDVFNSGFIQLTDLLLISRRNYEDSSYQQLQHGVEAAVKIFPDDVELTKTQIGEAVLPTFLDHSDSRTAALNMILMWYLQFALLERTNPIDKLMDIILNDDDSDSLICKTSFL